MATSSRPIWSRASRTTPICPSIIPLGPTTWAPASACTCAISAYRSSVASLSTRPCSSSTPQCPWSVVSSRHRSDMTSRSSPTSARTSRRATWRMPSGSVPGVPRASFLDSSGTPNSMIPETPAATASAAAFFRLSRVCCTTPGIDAMGTGSLTPSRTKAGRMRSAGWSRVSATIRRIAGVVRRRRGRVPGKDPYVVMAPTLRPPHPCLCRRGVGGRTPRAGLRPGAHAGGRDRHGRPRTRTDPDDRSPPAARRRPTSSPPPSLRSVRASRRTP
ncbi:hypothetical protein RKD26_002868 [Streptomyces calvus]